MVMLMIVILHFIKKIEGRTVYAKRNGENIRSDNIDVIVVSIGMESYNRVEKNLKGKIPFYLVGYAKLAIKDAYETVIKL